MAQVASFPPTFWVANVIELIERFSFYGVRMIAGLYIVTATEKGGLGFDNIDKGLFFGIWALIQCLLPMFTGGFSDRYGYRASLMIAFTINMCGYGLMAFVSSWWGFMLACCLVGTGTAIFKPPLHGTLAHCVTDANSSVGWGIFYQVVNIGGFVGPVVMGYLRLLEWKYAFLVAASVIVVNVAVMSLFLKDYSKLTQVGEQQKSKGPRDVLLEAFTTLGDKKFALFLAIFSGFWFMFMVVTDQLTIFIDQWVDSNDVASYLANATGLQFFKDLAKDGGQFNAEWIVNVDAGSIILLVVGVCYITSKFRHISAMIVGMFVACAGLALGGAATTGWACVFGIFVFAIGEMICSPKFSEYIGLMAPPEKKALYMGYSNLPFAVGWAATNLLGGPLYQHMSDKIALAQDYLIAHMGRDRATVEALTRGQVMPALAEALHVSERAVTQVLYDRYHPQYFFYLCILVGLASAVGMIAYHFWLEAEKKRKPTALA